MIELKNVSKIYNQSKPNERVVLNELNFSIREKDFVAVTGTSGIGKSTLLYIMSGLESFEHGSISVDGINLERLNDSQMADIRNAKFGIIMQDYALIEEFTVYENVILVLCFAKKRNKKQLVMEALRKVGIEDLAMQTVRELSGGQKQRVAIARAIVNNPEYLLADEPTGALDPNATKEVMALFGELNSAGQTIVLVTHDAMVASQCKRIVTIEGGKILE